MPLATMEAFRDHRKLRASLEEYLRGARQAMATLDRLGFSIDQVAAKVLDEGIGLFINPMNKVLDAIAAKGASAALAGTAAERMSQEAVSVPR